MRCLKFATVLVLALSSPAWALTEMSLPLDSESLVYTDSRTGLMQVAKGWGLPVFWFSGVGNHLNVESGVGYANLQLPGQQGHYGTAETDLVFHFDFGPLTPRIGIHNSLWAPLSPLPDLGGWMVGLAPTVGLGVDLGLFLLDARVSHGPVWNVSEKWPYRADLTRIEGRLTFGF